MRSRVIACRQRLRRIRAAHRSPGNQADTQADTQPRAAVELSQSVLDNESVVNLVKPASLRPDAPVAGRPQAGRQR